jgi:cytochrome c553
MHRLIDRRATEIYFVTGDGRAASAADGQNAMEASGQAHADPALTRTTTGDRCMRPWTLAATLALTSIPGAAVAQDVNLARNLAASCANCHGTNGHARGEMKPLAGMAAAKIAAAVADFKSGAQPATIMHQISKGYTDEQIKLVAAYFAAQPAQP